MSIFETIILYCFKKINGDRTIYSIYHLFKGKKSSQTIQDAHLFEITQYYGVFPAIMRETIEKAAQNAYANKWIVSCGEQRFRLTEIGERLLQEECKTYPDFHYLNGWKYHQKDLKFWERLSLLVQVISNLIHHETHYIPIQKNKLTHNWLKEFLKKNEMERNSLGNKLFSELTGCLEEENQLNPFVLILRLTGSEKIGFTSNQAAEILKMDLIRYHLEFLNILHYMIQKVSSPSGCFPLLGTILGDEEQRNILTKSTRQTYQLLCQGFSIEETAKFRHLKTSTIEDHIVELALHLSEFSIDEFTDHQLQQKILAAAKKADSKQLKQIKSMVSEANYFEIRLVLAKDGVKQWN